jgi:hypothetical protein
LDVVGGAARNREIFSSTSQAVTFHCDWPEAFSKEDCRQAQAQRGYFSGPEFPHVQ